VVNERRKAKKRIFAEGGEPLAKERKEGAIPEGEGIRKTEGVLYILRTSKGKNREKHQKRGTY